MKYYSSVMFIVLHLLLIQSKDDDSDDFFQKFVTTRKQPNLFLRSTNRPKSIFPYTFKQSIFNSDKSYPKLFGVASTENPFQEFLNRHHFTEYTQKSCIAEQTCSKWSNQWCCPLYLVCGIYSGCIQWRPKPTPSQVSSYKPYLLIIPIISAVAVILRFIYSYPTQSDQGNNFTINNSQRIMPRHRSIQHGSLPTCTMSAQQDTMNFNLPYLEISSRDLITSREQELPENDNHDAIGATVPIFEQQFPPPPPAYDQLSLQDSTTMEQQSLLPPTYSEFIHSTTARKSND